MQINIDLENGVVFVRGKLRYVLSRLEDIELAEGICIEFRDYFTDRKGVVVYLFYLHIDKDDFIAESFIKEKIVKKLFTK